MKLNKIPTVEEMKKEARKIAESIPNLPEKQKFMMQARGQIMECSITIERCFNQLITSTGKEMVLDHKKREFHLIKGIRNNKQLPRFKTKRIDIEKLIAHEFPKLDKDSKSNLSDALHRFVAIRDIFAHVPVNWNDVAKLEFIDNVPYKHFFELDSRWKDVLFAHNEFINLFQLIIDVILTYNRSIQLKEEILSVILLGKSQEEIRKEVEI